MINFGIECVSKFQEICEYGHLWLVEFTDWSKAIVIESIDEPGNDDGPANYIVAEIDPNV